MPRVAANLLLAACSLVVALLAAEAALQIVVRQVRPRFTRIDPALGWAHHPDTTHREEIEGHAYTLSYAEHGYRPPAIARERAPGIARVAVLGDSFVDASEVGDEETFAWRLREAMGVEVLNLGVYGYSTAQELLTLEQVGLGYRPDLVVLVSLSNDLFDNLANVSGFGPAPRFVLDGPGLRLEGTDHPSARAAFRAINLPAPGMATLHRESLVYYALNRYVYQRLIAERIVALRREQHRALPAPQRRELYRRLVLRTKQRCDESGAGFAVVFAPLESELESSDPPYRLAREALEADGVRTFDLHPPLRALATGDAPPLYYRSDIHWNARGHAEVARLLVEPIRRWLAEDRSLGR